jgi:N-glycosylase/DNA lyase
MSYFYFGGNDTSLKEIQKMAKEKFGRYEGFAQQYLFNYAREFKIGASEKKAGAKK